MKSKQSESRERKPLEDGNYNLFTLLGVKQGLGYAEGQLRYLTGDKAVEKTRKIEKILSSASKQIEMIIDPPSMAPGRECYIVKKSSYDIER